MGRLNSGDGKIIFGTSLCILIALMESGKAQCKKEVKTRKDFNIVSIFQEKFFTSELFKVIQNEISLILHYRTCCDSERFLRVHLSHREFRIDTGMTKFEQKTNGILSVCEYEHRTQRF